MSSSPEPLWSNNPNAPQIPYPLYFREKATLDETFIAAILYGLSSLHPPTRVQRVFLTFNPRDCYCSVLPMYKCIAESSQSCGRGYQVGTHVAHCDHVLAYYHSGRNALQQAIHFLRLQPNIPWWTHQIPGCQFRKADQHFFERHVSPEPVASRWPSGKFFFYQLGDHVLNDCRLFPQLYRCYVIYSMNYWAIAFPCLIYFASVCTYPNPRKLIPIPLINVTDSDRDRIHLGNHEPSLVPYLPETHCRAPRSFVLFGLRLAYRPPYAHDRRTIVPASKGYSECPWKIGWN